MIKKGFTLIELLIVVAIIAILAAIAVPNFLEAQIRAKISRVKNDLRTLSVGIESYSVDNNKAPYPKIYFVGGEGAWCAQYASFMTELTSPTPYLTTVEYPDPFSPQVKKYVPTSDGPKWGFRTREFFGYNYSSFDGWWGMAAGITPATQVRGYVLRSFGPDRAPQYPDYAMTTMTEGDAAPNLKFTGIFGGKTNPGAWYSTIYDSTNGTVSAGEIVRWGGGVAGPGQ